MNKKIYKEMEMLLNKIRGLESWELEELADKLYGYGNSNDKDYFIKQFSKEKEDENEVKEIFPHSKDSE